MALAELNVNTLEPQRSAHLLRRATFGASKEQITQFANFSPRDAVNALFRTSLPEPELPIDPATGTEWFTSGPTDANSEDLDSLFLGWIIGQMVATKQPDDLILPWSARERLVHFLHTHFTTIVSRVSSSRALYFQNKLFRTFALDDLTNDPEINFKNLTVKISVDNAMLRLLDGNLNVKGSVNENYARELLELYSIGRGLEGKGFPSTEQGDYGVYKEQDVRAAAAVLSGWDFDEDFANIDLDTEIPRGKVKGDASNASSHDNDTKQFSVRFGNATITPDPLLLNNGVPTEASALDEIRQLIDLIYSQEETAKNICRKIYRFYVWAPHTSEEMQPIEDNIISEMVKVFRDSGFKIQPVVENLLMSEHFYEAAAGVTDDNFGAMIKSPLDLSLGALQNFKIRLPDLITNATDFYEQTGRIISALHAMGMSFYEPYDVAGYEAYHQFPVYHRFWITPNALTQRYQFVKNIVKPADETDAFAIDAYAYIGDNFPDEAPNASALVVALAKHFFPVSQTIGFDETQSSLTLQRLNYFKGVLLGGFEEDYWTKLWNGTSLDDKRIPLQNLLNAMLQSPEYQLA